MNESGAMNRYRVVFKGDPNPVVILAMAMKVTSEVIAFESEDGKGAGAFPLANILYAVRESSVVSPDKN